MGRLDKPKSHAAHCALVIVGRQNASAKVHFRDSPLGRTDQDRVENGYPPRLLTSKPRNISAPQKVNS